MECDAHILKSKYLARPQVDVEVDELAVLLDEILQCVWLSEVVCFFLEVQTVRQITKKTKCVFSWNICA